MTSGSSSEPRYTCERFLRPDVSLALHRWAQDDVRAVVFYIHGTQSHAGWLFETGPALAAKGVATYAMDRRGSGVSAGARGDIGSWEQWREDYQAAMAEVRQRHATLPLLLVGQSFGGAIAVEVACDARAQYDALLLCAPLLVPGPLPDGWREQPEDQPVAIPTPDSYFCSRKKYLDFMTQDPLRLRALTPRFHNERIAMARSYMLRDAPLRRRPCVMLVSPYDKLAEFRRTTAAFEQLTGGTGILIQIPAPEHYLEFSSYQRTVWQLEAMFAECHWHSEQVDPD